MAAENWETKGDILMTVETPSVDQHRREAPLELRGESPMTRPALLSAIVEALRSAGATEETVAAVVKAGVELQNSPPRQRGRPRQYADDAARQRAWRRRNDIRDETQGGGALDGARNLRVRLLDASQGNADPAADITPIRALLDQGCDLEADVVPIVAREVPELPRPLKNWGAPWLVREILAAREQRLAEHRVEDAPPPRHTPAIQWDEFVGGYRAGLIEWNTARLGPKPGEVGCRAPLAIR
jgi:hypothetical protein